MGKYDSISTAVRHWLPIQSRVQFQINVITRNCLVCQVPEYFTELCHSINEIPARRNLRSSPQVQLLVPCFRKKRSGRRGSSISTPQLCPLHSILWTMPHFSTDFNILSVCPAMSSHGFDPTWLTAHPLLKSTRLPHPTQQYAQVYPRAPSLAHFFLFFISPVANVINPDLSNASNIVSFHQYADDTQLYIGTNLSTLAHQVASIESCTQRVHNWLLNNGLHLNPSKSEAIAFFNPRSKPLESLAESIASISVAGSPIKLQSSIKNLGVYLDSRMSFDRQVSETCKASYFHIRALRHIRPSLTTEACKTIAAAIVGSRLDYCNSLLAGTSVLNLAHYSLFKIHLPGSLLKNLVFATSHSSSLSCIGFLFATE